MQVRPDQGAPLGEAVLIVPLRQRVRLYKFFIKLWKPFKTAPSCF